MCNDGGGLNVYESIKKNIFITLIHFIPLHFSVSLEIISSNRIMSIPLIIFYNK